MKITHTKLRRIILEELKLISEEGSDWEKDRAAVVRGPDYKRKRQIRLDQQRKSSQRQKEREDWDYMDHVADQIWSRMFVYRSQHGDNLEKPTYAGGQAGGRPIADLSQEELEKIYAIGPDKGRENLKAIELIGSGIYHPDRDIMRDMIKDELQDDRGYWEYTVKRAEQSMGRPILSPAEMIAQGTNVDSDGDGVYDFADSDLDDNGVVDSEETASA
jgi:hypothetical protein